MKCYEYGPMPSINDCAMQDAATLVGQCHTRKHSTSLKKLPGTSTSDLVQKSCPMKIFVRNIFRTKVT